MTKAFSHGFHVVRGQVYSVHRTADNLIHLRPIDSCLLLVPKVTVRNHSKRLMTISNTL